LTHCTNDNAIILYYPPGAGGKFLISCLCLADNVAFPDVEIAYDQLHHGLSQTQKYDILSNAITAAQDKWNDFLLMPSYFAFGAGKHQNNYNFGVLKFLIDNIDQEFNITEFLVPDAIIDKIKKQKMYFLTFTHSIFQFYFFSQYWKDSFFINFKNSINFSEKYRKKYIQQYIDKNDNYNLFRYVNGIRRKYNYIAGVDWPSFNIVLNKELDEYSTVVNEIKTHYPEIFKDLNQMHYLIDFYKNLKSKNNVIDFNTDVFFDKQKTINSIEQLYKKLNLTNYNQNLISSLYDQWISKLDELKTKNVNETDLIEQLKKYVKNKDFKNASKCLNGIDIQ